MTIPLAAPVDFSKQAEVDKMAKSIKDALHKELAKDNPFGPQGNTTVEVMITKKNMRKRRDAVPATADVKVQYTAPTGTKQIHDSKSIASNMAQSTQAALSTPEMKKVVDQVGLMMVQPSVIVAQPETQSKNETKNEPQSIKKAKNPATKKPYEEKPASISSSNRIIPALTMCLLSYLYV